MSEEKLFPESYTIPLSLQVKAWLSEGYIVVKLDRHESRRTSASTKWKLPKGAKKIYSTIDMNKTHWFDYYVVKPNDILLRIRITNRGNWDIRQFTAETLKVSDEELNNLLLIIDKNE
jgi:hypothetical protein